MDYSEFSFCANKIIYYNFFELVSLKILNIWRFYEKWQWCRRRLIQCTFGAFLRGRRAISLTASVRLGRRRKPIREFSENPVLFALLPFPPGPVPVSLHCINSRTVLHRYSSGRTSTENNFLPFCCICANEKLRFLMESHFVWPGPLYPTKRIGLRQPPGLFYGPLAYKW